MINGVTRLFMMKADVLNDFDEIKVCTQYQMPDGRMVEELPYDMNRQLLQPVYHSLPGWKKQLSGIEDFARMPDELLSYVDFLEEALDVPIGIVSVGPDRTQTILRDEMPAF